MNDTNAEIAPEDIPTHAVKRYVSVDALRGFDMFWLIGGTGFFMALIKLVFGLPRKGPHTGIGGALLKQLDHSAWQGCTWYDTIFPLFVFVIGMSVVFSLSKYKEEKKTGAAYRRIIRRFILLYFLGFLYYGGFSHPWPEIRLLGVLPRLALCYLGASILFLHFKPRTLIIIAVGILIGYWILFSFVPVPDTGKTGVSEATNWARYIDAHYLPGKKHDGDWDNCGILSTFTAISTCLMGVLASLYLRDDSVSDKKKVLVFIGGGVLLIIAGWLWGLQFPVIKKIWTSSYVLVTGGWSLALLGIFYLLLDVWHVERGVHPLIWIGANPLTIYLAENFIDFTSISNRLVGGSVHNVLGESLGHLALRATSLALSLAIVWFLYRKKVFIRV